MGRVDTRRYIEPVGVRKAGNTGLVNINLAVTSFALHTLPIGTPSTAKIRKILAFNATGANVNLMLGYLTLAAAFVQTIPDLFCLNGFENIWNEADLPNYEFRPDTTLVTGTLGDIIAQISACPANQVAVILEVEEIRQ